MGAGLWCHVLSTVSAQSTGNCENVHSPHRFSLMAQAAKSLGCRCLAAKAAAYIQIGTTYRHIVTDTTKSFFEGHKRVMFRVLHACAHTASVSKWSFGYTTYTQSRLREFPGNKAALPGWDFNCWLIIRPKFFSSPIGDNCSPYPPPRSTALSVHCVFTKSKQ